MGIQVTNDAFVFVSEEVMQNKNREAWLLKAIDKGIGTLFKQRRAKLPKIKVSVGLPYGRGGKKAIGQHWAPEASDDKKGSIFISPRIDDSILVLSVLVHELVHASVGNKVGHGGAFKNLAWKVGLTGKMTEAHPDRGLKTELERIVGIIGKYPHAKLNLAMNPVKKQTTRMIKMVCEDCGYIARASRTLILHIGPTLCPCNRKPMAFDVFEIPAVEGMIKNDR